MYVPIGKSFLGLMSAACIVVPAGVPQAAAEIAPTGADASSYTTADPALFDPVPATLRLVTEAVIALQDNAPGVGNSAALTLGDDPLQLAIELLTFPYHNIYGVTSAVGDAFTDFLMAGLLPLSIASFVIVNQDEKIPAYVEQVLTNLKGAIPGVFTAIQNEILYDIGLFRTLFNPWAFTAAETETTRTQVVPSRADAAVTDNPVQLLVELATFPYHNSYAIISSVGAAFTDFLMAALLPVSIASFVLVNEDEKIPDYVNSVISNLGTAIPEIFTTIRDEIAYDVSLFQRAFSLIGGQGASEEEAQVSNATVSATTVEVAAVDDEDAEIRSATTALDDGSSDSDTQGPTTGFDGAAPTDAGDTQPGEDAGGVSDEAELSVDEGEPDSETEPNEESESGEEGEDTTDLVEATVSDEDDTEQADGRDSSPASEATAHSDAPDGDGIDAEESGDDESTEGGSQ